MATAYMYVVVGALSSACCSPARAIVHSLFVLLYQWDTAGQAALGVRMANQLLLLMEKHADKDKANTKRPP